MQNCIHSSPPILPFSREEVRNGLRLLHENTDTTFLMVTHDFAEALTLADRGAIIHHGAIGQVGEIHDTFHRPASAAAAEFVGMKNLFEAGVSRRRGRVRGA